ncbi:hypothetical protein ACIOWI_37470, partial [Streptomyces sp. NPDC087659]|uniref:hypothetical protein n=1 Tax=Streptomyces sp. NPDC087659 TaxID=3365801 RepID=UPI0038154F10
MQSAQTTLSGQSAQTTLSVQSVVNESVGGDQIVALPVTTLYDAWNTFAGQDPEKAAAVLSAALGALHSDLSDADAVKQRYASLTDQQRLWSVMDQATALHNLIAHGRIHIGLKGGADPDWYQAYAGSTGPQAQASGSGLRDGGHSNGDDPLRDGSGHEDLNGNNWGDGLFDDGGWDGGLFGDGGWDGGLFGDGAGLGDLFDDGGWDGGLFDDGAGLGDLFGDGGWDGGLFGDGGGAGGLALPGGDQPVQLPPAVEPFDDFLALTFASAGTGEAPTAPAAESVFPDAGAGAQAALQGLASIGWTTLQAQGAWSREGIPPLGVPETQGLFQALFLAENELVTCGGVWEYVQQHHNTELTAEDIMDLRYRYQQAYDTGLLGPPRKEPKAVPYGKFTSQEVADGITEFYGNEENAKYRGFRPPQSAVVEVGGKTWHIGWWFDHLSRRGVKGPLPGVVVTALGAAGIKIRGNESAGFTIDARAHGAVTAQEIADGITEFYGNEENAKYHGHLPPQKAVIEVGGKTWRIGRWLQNLSRQGVKRPLPDVVVTALGAAGISIIDHPQHPGFVRIDAPPYVAMTAEEFAAEITKFYGNEENAKYRGFRPPARAVVEVGGRTWSIGRWFHYLSREGVKGPLPGVVVEALGAAGFSIIDHPQHPGFVRIDTPPYVAMTSPYVAMTAEEFADGINEFYGKAENAKYRGFRPPQSAVVEVGGKTWRIGWWFDHLSRRGVKGPLPDIVVEALGAAGISIIDHPDRAGFVKTNEQTQRRPVAEAMRQYLLNHLPIAPSRGYVVVLEGTDTAISVGQHLDDLRNRGWVASQAGGHAGERAV